MHFPVRKHNLWSLAMFDDGDGGGGGGGDAADAAAEGVGGGTGVGGTATASEAAGGAIGGDIGAGSASTAAAAADPSLGFGVPGIDPSVGAVDPGMSAADIGFSASDIGAVGGIGGPSQGFADAPGVGQEQPGIVDRTRAVLERTSPISNPNIANIGRSIMGFVNPMSPVVTALGLGYQAITGREAISQTAAEAVADQEATAAEAGAGDTATSPFGLGNPIQGRAGLPATAGQPATGGLPATPAFQRPARLDIPPELLPYLNPGMNDLQLRSAISTGALYNANPAYRSQGVQDFYNNLVARSLIDDSGNFRDMNEILPVEQQYALQSRGAQGYQPNAQSFLQSLGAI